MESLNVIKVIIADDHKLVRCGIKLMLKTDPKFSVTSEAASGTDVLNQLKMNKEADIILADLHMPDMSGLELMQQLKTEYQALRVIFLTMAEDENLITAAFNHGAEGYLTKDISTEELIFAINYVYNGGKYISANLSHRFFIKSVPAANLPVPATSSLKFNSREIEVLELISEGLTNCEMGEKLFLSKRTVEGHRRALIDKTKCRNSAALIKYAVIHGLIR
jgi:DNA-binding NarL/FixJ family response regulator